MRALLCWVGARGFARHRLRTTLAVLGVALGVAAVLAIRLVHETVLADLRRATERLSGRAELVVSGDRTGVPEALLDRIRAVPGVRNASSLVKQVAALKAVEGRPARGMLQIVGVDTLDERWLPTGASLDDEPVVRDQVTFLEQPYSLIVTRAFAREHGIEGRTDRATVSLSTSDGVRRFTVRGTLRGDGPERIFGANFALMDVDSARKVFGKPGRYDEIHVLLRADVTDAERDDTRARILAVVGPGFDVERPQNRGRHAERVIATMQSGLTLLSVLALFVGMLLIYSVLSVSVAERRHEIGVLRALGASRARIAGLFAAEASLLGVVGAALGVAAGVGLAQGLLRVTCELLSTYVTYADFGEVHLPAATVVTAVAAGIFATLVAGVLPALRASRVSPLEATRPSTEEAARRRRTRVGAIVGATCLGLCGVGLLVPAVRESEPLAFACTILLLAGAVLVAPVLLPALVRVLAALLRVFFGVPGRLAEGALLRGTGRAAVAVGAILVGFALAISSGTLAESFRAASRDDMERSIPADILVTCSAELWTPTSMPMSPALEPLVRAHPGVEDVQRLRMIDVRIGARRAELAVMDVAAWSRRAGLAFVRGDAKAAVSVVARGDGVVVSENFASGFGLHVGDTVELRAPRGLVRLPIVGVVVNYTSIYGLVVMDRSAYQRYWDDDLVDVFHVHVKPGADPRAVRAAIEGDLKGRYDVFVLTSADVKERVRELLDDSFAIVRVLELVALVVALLGLLNVMMISVLERSREIAVLRALGAQRRHVAAAIVLESAALGVAGALLGLLAGVALSFANVEVLYVLQTGWRLEYRFPARAIALLLLLTPVVAAAAGLWPATRAARAPIARALAEE